MVMRNVIMFVLIVFGVDDVGNFIVIVNGVEVDLMLMVMWCDWFLLIVWFLEFV